MKSFLAEKKIGPTPTKVEVNVKQPNKVQQRFAPIQDPKKPGNDPKKPGNDPEETSIIPAFEWQRHLSGLCKSSAIIIDTNFFLLTAFLKTTFQQTILTKFDLTNNVLTNNGMS